MNVAAPPRRSWPTAAAAQGAAAALFDLIYPPRCVLCGAFGPESLCEQCAEQIPLPLPEPVCPRCGHPRPSLPCAECLGDPPHFVACVAAGHSAGSLLDAVHWLKYRERPLLAEPLGRILADHARRHAARLGGLQCDAIVPVPLHPIRRRARGYNQSERLARVVGRELCLPLAPALLRRVRSTRPQVGLSGEARHGNLAGAFRADAGARDKTLLLIDDVSTTGTTFRACAEALKEAGARSVYCLCLAAG